MVFNVSLLYVLSLLNFDLGKGMTSLKQIVQCLFWGQISGPGRD